MGEESGAFIEEEFGVQAALETVEGQAEAVGLQHISFPLQQAGLAPKGKGTRNGRKSKKNLAFSVVVAVSGRTLGASPRMPDTAPKHAQFGMRLPWGLRPLPISAHPRLEEGASPA
jgi:hypothetical protein